MKRMVLAVVLTAGLVAQAHAGGWSTVHRYVHPTGKCGAGQREVMSSHYCESGGRLAGGGRMNCAAVTAASWEYAMHSTIAVTNPRTGRTCSVHINDTGPNGIARRMGDVLDLSSGASDCLRTGRNTTYVCAPAGGKNGKIEAFAR